MSPEPRRVPHPDLHDAVEVRQNRACTAQGELSGRVVLVRPPMTMPTLIPRLLAPSGSSTPVSAARVALQLSDGTILVAAGLEVEHFKIGLAESPDREGWRQPFSDAALALAHLDPSSEFWQVAVRDSAARHDSLLRVGLLAIGRAASLVAAEDAATELLAALERIVSVFWRQLRAERLLSVERLSGFLEPALQPVAQSLRRRRLGPTDPRLERSARPRRATPARHGAGRGSHSALADSVEPMDPVGRRTRRDRRRHGAGHPSDEQLCRSPVCSRGCRTGRPGHLRRSPASALAARWRQRTAPHV